MFSSHVQPLNMPAADFTALVFRYSRPVTLRSLEQPANHRSRVVGSKLLNVGSMITDFTMVALSAQGTVDPGSGVLASNMRYMASSPVDVDTTVLSTGRWFAFRNRRPSLYRKAYAPVSSMVKLAKFLP